MGHKSASIKLFDVQGYMAKLYNVPIETSKGNEHDVFVAVLIVECALKAATCRHLLLSFSTCDAIQGCATIKINHKNKLFVLTIQCKKSLWPTSLLNRCSLGLSWNTADCIKNFDDYPGHKTFQCLMLCALENY